MKINLPQNCVIIINDNNIKNLKQIQLLLHENGYYWISGISLLSKLYPQTKKFVLRNKSITWNSDPTTINTMECIDYKTLLNLKNLYED
jgi:Na+-translocating ferredoxin:NAD+ oxidoreductase RnfC subunit